MIRRYDEQGRIVEPDVFEPVQKFTQERVDQRELKQMPLIALDHPPFARAPDIVPELEVAWRVVGPARGHVLPGNMGQGDVKKVQGCLGTGFDGGHELAETSGSVREGAGAVRLLAESWRAQEVAPPLLY